MLCVERGVCSLTWMMHLHFNQKSDYDDDDGKYFMIFCHLIFFHNHHVQKILKATQSERQTVWIQIRPHNNVGPDLDPDFL